MPLKRVSSDHPRRPRSQSSRPSFSGALSSSRVPAAEFGSLTGVSLMQHLDRVEAEERAFGIGEPPEGSEEDGESSSWGVRSENDVRYSTSSQDVEGKPTNWRERVRETLSFDIDRAAGGGAPNLGWLKGRNRSGSVGGVSRGGKGRGRGGHGRYTSVGIEEGNGSWLGEYGEGRVPEEEEEEEEEPRKKVVVVEVRSFWLWCEGTCADEESFAATRDGRGEALVCLVGLSCVREPHRPGTNYLRHGNHLGAVVCLLRSSCQPSLSASLLSFFDGAVSLRTTSLRASFPARADSFARRSLLAGLCSLAALDFGSCAHVL